MFLEDYLFPTDDKQIKSINELTYNPHVLLVLVKATDNWR